MRIKAAISHADGKPRFAIKPASWKMGWLYLFSGAVFWDAF